ncbi:MAG: NAD(P)-binding protein [Deltaproteobacteria bacterium]|nr:NAD(P)-binding protein [Deltaproteobacteria bacterium]
MNIEIKNKLSRRNFIRVAGAGGLVLYLESRLGVRSASARTLPRIPDISPIDRFLGDKAPAKFFADSEPERAHAVLWNKASFLSSYNNRIPAPQERVPLVVIGGGISGLTTAYLLRDFKPIVLEQAPNFGGNSKGQSWRGIDYAIGAAYLVKPDEGSDIEKLLQELHLGSKWREKGDGEPFELNGAVKEHFWSGAAQDSGAAQFKKLSSYFQSIWDGEGEPFPEIPVIENEQRSYINKLDSISFRTHLEKVAGGALDPLIEAAMEQYCWSSFGGTLSEISAASGLNFYCAEFGEILALPGGNAAVAERLLTKIAEETTTANLRVNSLVFDVTVTDDGVLVTYRDEKEEIRSIHAKAAVLAIPKFIAGRVLNGIEDDRMTAIRRLRYRSYLVANVLINGSLDKEFYDLYLLGDGKINNQDLVGSVREQKVTDVILGNFASPTSKDTVLTLYRGFPYDGVRAELYIPGSYERFRAEFETQIFDQILPLLKLKKGSVVDIRIARWGHPLPLAATGLIAEGVPDTLRKPFKEKVFFVEQDNWALPAFETAVGEALHFAPLIRKKLQA